ncbi:MAG TPA: hypothetical protein VE912_14035, partial [Bacteroidales bacterium]|nr:hypothetical protein [Bacteroidales bacterium]
HTGKGKNPISPELLCYIRGNFFIGTHPNVGGQYFIQKFSSRGNYLTGFHPLTFRLRWAPEVTKFPKVDGVTKNLLYFADRIQPKIYIYEIDGTLSNEYWMKPLHTAHIQLVHELDKRLKHRSSSRGIRIQDIFSKLMYKTDHFEFVQVHSQYIYVEMVYRYLLFNRKGKCLFDLDLEPYKTGPQSVKYPNTSKFRFITGGETAGGWSNGLIRCGFLPHKPSEPPSGIIQVSIYKYRPSDDSAS